MKMQEALAIIVAGQKEKGFMVSFEKKEGSVLGSNYFPDKHAGEELIETEEKAWELAEQFAKATDDTYVNIYVIDADFAPVKGYDKRVFKRIY